MEFNKPLIYIASPYTRGLKSKNARHNIEMWTYFTEHCPGYDFYPALWPAHVMHMSNDLGRGEFPDVDEKYWLNYDLNMLDKCQGIILVNGWDGAKWTESSGCNGEFEHAQEMDIKMFCQASEPECKFIAGVVKALNENKFLAESLTILSSKEEAEKFSKERLEPDMGYRGTPILSMLNDVKIVNVSRPQKVHVVDLGSYGGLNIDNQDKTHSVYRRIEYFKEELLKKGFAVGFTVNQDTVVMELPEPIVFEWEDFYNSALTTRIMTALSAEQLGAKK